MHKVETSRDSGGGFSTRQFIREFGTAVQARADESARLLADGFAAHIAAQKQTPPSDAYDKKCGRVAAKLLDAFPDIDTEFAALHAPALAKHLQKPPQTEIAEMQKLLSQLESTATSLSEEIQTLADTRSKMLEGIRSKTMHRFSAGGCVFSVTSAALERHALSYLATLANGDFAVRTDAQGAWSVENVTAMELCELCHFFEHDELIRGLARADRRAADVVAQYGSPAMMAAMPEPCAGAYHALFDPRTLDPEKVTKHCYDDGEVEGIALRLATALKEQLDPHLWREFELFIPLDRITSRTVSFHTQFRWHNLLKEPRGLQDDAGAPVLKAIAATSRWLVRSGAPFPRFSGTGRMFSVAEIGCNFDP